MSTANRFRVISILAGAIWLGLLIVEFASRARVLNEENWDYLGVLAAGVFVILMILLYRRARNPALVIMAAGSAALGLSFILYAIEFDPEDGAAFMMFLLGTIVLGLGLAALGYRFRSLDETTGMGTALLLLGIYLILVFPIWIVMDMGFGLNVTDRFGDQIWGSVLFVQAISWISMSGLGFGGHLRLENRPVHTKG